MNEKDSVLRALTRIAVALRTNATGNIEGDVDDYVAQCTDISSALNVISTIINNGGKQLLPDEEETADPGSDESGVS